MLLSAGSYLVFLTRSLQRHAHPGSTSISLHQHRPALCAGPPLAEGIAVEGRALENDGEKK